eukprot:scaffold27.g6023.t1
MARVLSARVAVPAIAPQPRRLSARRCRGVRVDASKLDSYVSPSSRTGANELTVLERWSEVVPDVVLSQTLQDLEAPKAATASRSVLAGIMSTPATMRRFKFAIEQARFYDKCEVDKALVNVGALLLENISGRVSTEVDPRVAFDTDRIVARGRSVISMYEEVGVPRDRVILRLPATWAGIQAAKQLEACGIATHLVLVYSFVQGAAAAQAGVSVVQPNVGRLVDWYNRHPGMIRGPNAQPEARAMALAGYGTEDINPGLLLVEKLYCYCKRYHPKTLVMASGLRSKQEALALAGCDFLVVGPKVLKSLSQMSTLEGYNDGLRSVDPNMQELAPQLSPSIAQRYEFNPDDLAAVTESDFNAQLGMAAQELLAEGVHRLIEDANRLEPYFINLASGQE